jgi:hypothetical protein
MKRRFMEFTAFERAVIESILSQPVEGMDILRQQFATASVVKCDPTSVGFYTTISDARAEQQGTGCSSA